MCLAVPLEIIRLLPGSKAVVALGQGRPKAGAAMEGQATALGQGRPKAGAAMEGQATALGQGSRAREEQARQPGRASGGVMASDSGRDNAPASGSGELQVDVSLIDNPKPGDHVIVHAGYAIEILSLQEAEERLGLFRKMAELMGEEA